MAVDERADEFTLAGVKKSYDDLEVLAGIYASVPRDGILAVLGPSGCGKTTLLSLIAGLMQPDAGKIDGLTGKSISYVFQEPRLLDWLTVAGNIAFVLRDRMSAGAVEEAVASYLARLGLWEYCHVYPRRLSGGQRQRVSMARALAYPSRVLLMDEPFKSLDLGLKLDLIQQFNLLWTDEPRTVVCVTHDVKEALLLADSIVLLSAKPSTVTNRWEIDLPRAERSLDHLGLMRLEREILRELLPRPACQPG